MRSLVKPACLALALLAAAAAPASGAGFEVHAHRGGTLSGGVPKTPENSLTAFGAAIPAGADVVELDTHVTSDGVPFAMHDGDLDRTTDCTGAVAEHTAAEVDACHVDILGTTDVFTQAPGSTEPVPRLAAVLDWAKGAGAKLNIELNYYPTERTYGKTPNFVAQVLDAIDASGIPKSRLLIQSFLPSNIDPAKARGFRTAIVTFDFANASAVDTAEKGGYDVVEPQWPVDAAFVKRAHAAGKRVIPFTVDRREDVMAVRTAGADGVISNDPSVAAAAVRCVDARTKVKQAARSLRAARAAAGRARGTRQRRSAARRVKSAKRKLAKARAAAKRACA